MALPIIINLFAFHQPQALSSTKLDQSLVHLVPLPGCNLVHLIEQRGDLHAGLILGNKVWMRRLFKSEYAASKLYHVTRDQYLHTDAHAVDVGAVGGAVVIDHQVAALVGNPGVVAGDGRIGGEDDVSPRLPSHRHILARQQKNLPVYAPSIPTNRGISGPPLGTMPTPPTIGAPGGAGVPGP